MNLKNEKKKKTTKNNILMMKNCKKSNNLPCKTHIAFTLLNNISVIDLYAI